MTWGHCENKCVAKLINNFDLHLAWWAMKVNEGKVLPWNSLIPVLILIGATASTAAFVPPVYDNGFRECLHQTVPNPIVIIVFSLTPGQIAVFYTTFLVSITKSHDLTLSKNFLMLAIISLSRLLKFFGLSLSRFSSLELIDLRFCSLRTLFFMGGILLALNFQLNWRSKCLAETYFRQRQWSYGRRVG